MGYGLFQPGHLIIILIIALIIFGPGKLPELGSSLGNGIREFKKSIGEIHDEPQAPTATAVPPPATSVAAPLASGSVTCSGCQAAMPADARYCTRCGQQLAAA